MASLAVPSDAQMSQLQSQHQAQQLAQRHHAQQVQQQVDQVRQAQQVPRAQAQLQAQASAQQRQQVQPLIVIRVKRKRSDAPVEELVVTESVVERPKKRMNIGRLANKLSDMSTAERSSAVSGGGAQDGSAAETFQRAAASTRTKRRRDEDEDEAEQTYMFTRLKGTMNMTAAAGVQGSSITNNLALADQLLAAGLTANSTSENATSVAISDASTSQGRPPAKRARTRVSVIDIVPEKSDNIGSDGAASASASASTSASSAGTPAIVTKAATSTAITILTPFEEIMDKAIYNAFVDGASCCAGLLSAISRGGPVNFQRKLAANTTALMAAAHWRKTHIVKSLLERGAIKSLCDNHGRTALDFAIQQGHGPTIRILSDTEDSQSGEEGGTHDGDAMNLEPSPASDEVYDYFVMSDNSGNNFATPSADVNAAHASATNASANSARVAASTSARARIKSYHVSLFGGSGANQNDGNSSDSDDEHSKDHLRWGVNGQHDDEYAHEALDDENHEGYAANEYPDEELLTSDDGRMYSNSEGSSQEDEDYW